MNRKDESYNDALSRIYAYKKDRKDQNSLEITFQVTEACNLNCKYCYQGEKTPKVRRCELWCGWSKNKIPNKSAGKCIKKSSWKRPKISRTTFIKLQWLLYHKFCKMHSLFVKSMTIFLLCTIPLFPYLFATVPKSVFQGGKYNSVKFPKALRPLFAYTPFPHRYRSAGT